MLKEEREKKGLTQKELSAKANINLSNIRAYEQGTRNINNISISNMINLCVALDCDINNILTDETLKLKYEIMKKQL